MENKYYSIQEPTVWYSDCDKHQTLDEIDEEQLEQYGSRWSQSHSVMD
jgi:hypothetical protein